MADEVLVCVADPVLRDVLGLGLALDGHLVWPVDDEAAARRLLARRSLDLLLLDGTMPLSEDPLIWLDRYAADTPAVVFVARAAMPPQPARPDVRLLAMPFGHAELHRRIEAVRAARAGRGR